MTNTRTKVLAGIAALAVVGASGGAIAVATGGDDDATERPITGSALERAGDAALESTGGGRVTDTERDDEEGYYEVEVTRDDGSEVDVHLNRDFNVTGSEEDDDSGEDED